MMKIMTRTQQAANGQGTELQRRRWLADPGENLLVPPSQLETTQRLSRFLDESRLPEDLVLTTPIVSVPMPVYTGDHPPGRRWRMADPAALWHPWMWLPDRISKRYTLQPTEGDSWTESIDVWSLRLVLESTWSGLYDPDSGTWLDVLAMHGIDTDAPNDVQRVANWLEGDADEVLDGIDLSVFTENPEEPHWAVDAALAMIDDMRVLGWAFTADNLLFFMNDLVAAANGEDKETGVPDFGVITRGTATHVRCAVIGLGGISGHERWWWEQHMAAVDNAADVFDGDATGFVACDAVANVVTRLQQLRDTYWPYVTELAELADVDAEPST